MSLATYLIHKPKDWVEPNIKYKLTDYLHIIKNHTYLKIWFIFYLNITCGLALISFEKTIGLYAGIINIGILAAFTALFNTIGRFGYSTASDFLMTKAWIYWFIFLSSLIGILIGAVWIVFIPAMLCIINAGYGGGFSTLPTLLQSKFGMEKISTIHGLALSAWAWAGLSGNQISNFVINKMQWSYETLFLILGGLYLISLLITISIIKEKN
jgi:OFA family oxalate/formate antiporter-like MFS transporter